MDANTTPSEGVHAWQAKAAAKRVERARRIPSEWRLPEELLQGNEHSDQSVLDVPRAHLTPSESAITENYDASSLAKAVQSGAIKAANVATAFCKRAAIAHQLINCLTEIFFDEAIARGRWLDEYLAANNRPVGPLHGVPISMKETFNHVGIASSLGIVSFLDNPVAQHDSAVVEILLELGAILYCKTNIPQASMSADSHNNVFGRTLNPHKLNISVGGSTGGESALIALRGSILGVGTDIAGSIRIPSLCCGTYGFKPTPCRVPNGGQTFIGRGGSPSFPLATGPHATTMEDLAFFTRHVIDAKPWEKDATAPAVPWRASVADSAVTGRRIRVGYYKEEPPFLLHPPVLRTMEKVAEILASSANFEVVPITTAPSLEKAMHLAFDHFSLDNRKTFHHNIIKSGEPVTPSIQGNWHILNHKPTDYTLDDVFDINMQRGALKTAWHKLWVDNALDVILTPGHRATAAAHDSYGDPPYTVLWNLLEWPAVVIPVGYADKNIDIEVAERRDEKYPYDAEMVHGAPTAIQLVGRGFQDEELIAVARQVDQAIAGANTLTH